MATSPLAKKRDSDTDSDSVDSDDQRAVLGAGAGFDIDDNDIEALRAELQEVSSDSGSSSGGSSDSGKSSAKGKKSSGKKARRKKAKSAWSSVGGSKASGSASASSKLSHLVRSVGTSAHSKASSGDRDERYLKEFAALAKKRSPLNKKFKFKGKHMVYHGMDPNEAASEEVEFESDWAPILIRASGKRMNPRKVQNMLPLLKQKIGQLVVNDAGMKRVIRPAYLKHKEQPRHIGAGFTVCFNYSGLSLTHAEVKAAIESRLRDTVQMPFAITSIQFLPLASQLEIPGMDNRWLVTLSRNDAKLELIRFGLKLRASYVTVRDYGDVQRIEIAVWCLLNQDRCDSANSATSSGGRAVLTTTPSGSDYPGSGTSASLLTSARSLASSSGASGSGALGCGIVGSDIDRVKYGLMRRRGTYAEIRHILNS